MLFSSIKERIEHFSGNLVNMPLAGIEPTSPCILVRSANHYTIRDHQTGNVAVSWLVKLFSVWGFPVPILFFWVKCKCGQILLKCVSPHYKAQINWIIPITITVSIIIVVITVMVVIKGIMTITIANPYKFIPSMSSDYTYPVLHYLQGFPRNHPCRACFARGRNQWGVPVHVE